MSVLAYLFSAMDRIPIARDLLHSALQRRLEIEIVGPLRYPGQNREHERAAPSFNVIIEDPSDPARFNVRPWAMMHFTLQLTNHREDRKERIVGARIVIKRRRLLFWRKTIIEFPVCHPAGGQKSPAITDVEIPPMSPRVRIDCIVDEKFDNPGLPKRAELRLVLDMVGPIRRVERLVDALDNPNGL